MSSIKTELLELKRDGILKAEIAVEWAASHPRSALHGALEWNDVTAGHQHRLWQMRQLITLHVVSEERAPEMVSLSIDRINPGGGYRPISDVLAAPALRQVMLTDALNELQRVEQKYRHLVELASVWGAVEKVRQQHVTTEATTVSAA